jgi:hypothetical protein
LKEAGMMEAKTRLSTGDLQRELRLSRSRLERILRDWARELPSPEIVAGSRLWPAEALEAFRLIVARDQEGSR